MASEGVVVATHPESISDCLSVSQVDLQLQECFILPHLLVDDLSHHTRIVRYTGLHITFVHVP